jgi:hypothetical protein
MGPIGYRIFVALGLTSLVGCSSVSYLNPIGPGKAHTLTGLCPYPSRVLEVAVPGSDARIYIDAFEAHTRAAEALVFVAVSDRTIHFNWAIEPNRNLQKQPHTVSFPEGLAIQVNATDGRSAHGGFVTVSDGAGGVAAVVLKYTLPAGVWENFTATFPAITVDGRRVEIGAVKFEPGRATIHGINC